MRSSKFCGKESNVVPENYRGRAKRLPVHTYHLKLEGLSRSLLSGPAGNFDFEWKDFDHDQMSNFPFAKPNAVIIIIHIYLTIYKQLVSFLELN